MQYMLIGDLRVPVRDNFNVWPDNWSQNKENKVLKLWKAGEFLNQECILILDAWTNRNNIAKALNWIKPTTFQKLGFKTACQVHGNRWQAPCGCVHDFVFDHHKRDCLTCDDIKPFRSQHICINHNHLNNIETQFWTAAYDSGPDIETWKPNGIAVTGAKDLLRLLEKAA